MQEDIPEQYKLDEDSISERKKIGKGGFGTVYSARYHGAPVAVKTIKGGRRANKKQIMEIKTMLMLIHPYVLRCLGFYLSDGGQKVNIVMDLMHTNASRYCPDASLKEKLTIMEKMATAVQFLHSKTKTKPTLIHNDIKPSNFLISKDGKEVKISDFGLSRIKKHSTIYSQSENVRGSFLYFPPEFATEETIKYSIYSDIYSLGITFYELLYNKPPFFEIESFGMFAMMKKLMKKKNYHPKYFAEDEDEGIPHVPNDIYADLLMKMWERVPYQRIPLEMVIKYLGNRLSPSATEKQKEEKERYLRIAEKERIQREKEDEERREKERVEKEEKAKQEKWKAQREKLEKLKNEKQKLLEKERKDLERIEQERKEVERKRKEVQERIERENAALLVEMENSNPRNFVDVSVEKTPSEYYQEGLKFYDKSGKDEENNKKAFGKFLLAAKGGDARGMFCVGVMYHKGRGVKKDYVEAVKWYRKAAEQGHSAGRCNLGSMYRNGHGVKKDYVEAVKWYRKAAEQGNSNAQCSLGIMYRKGLGVEKNYVEAMQLYKKAAEQGNPRGLHAVGFMYEKGYGVEKSIETAIFWFEKAAKKGSSLAIKRLKKLKN